MKVTASFAGLGEFLAEEQRKIDAGMLSAITEVTTDLKAELRGQIARAGLSNRLAGSWRSRVYANADRRDQGPAGFVWSRAPAIIAAFATGATIKPIRSRYLPIPTENVPRIRGKGPASPEDVERIFGQKLIFKRGRNGSLLAFINAVRGLNHKRSGYRPPTVRRIRQGRKSELVLMFTYARAAKMPKLLDLDGAASSAADRVVSLASRRIGD